MAEEASAAFGQAIFAGAISSASAYSRSSVIESTQPLTWTVSSTAKSLRTRCLIECRSSDRQMAKAEVAAGAMRPFVRHNAANETTPCSLACFCRVSE